jgi:hypothetical protein
MREAVASMEHITSGELQRMFADVADAGSYGCFEYQGISVGFYSDDATLLESFTKYFGGYFTVTGSHQTDAVVYSSQDPVLFQRLKEGTTSRGEARSGEETEYAVDAQHRIIYRREVDEAKGKVGEHCIVLSQLDRNVLVSSPGTFKSRRTTVKRSLRNMMKLLLMEKGWVPLHSAACILNDTGICILGGKFAGKTSTLINLLAQPGAKFVSSDNLFLRDGGTFLESCGFPNNTGLRIGTLAAHPWLADRLEKATESFHPRIDGKAFRDIVATTPAAELVSRPEKIVLLSTELAELFDIPIEQVTRIELLLVIQFDPSLAQSHMSPVTDPQQVGEYLAANVRSLSKEKQDFLQGFFDFNDNTLQAALDELQEKFTSRVAVYELRQSANTNEHSAEMVGRLTHQIHEHV